MTRFDGVQDLPWQPPVTVKPLANTDLLGCTRSCCRGYCSLCNGESPAWPFIDHYSCIQRYRQLSVRLDWVLGERELHPEKMLYGMTWGRDMICWQCWKLNEGAMVSMPDGKIVHMSCADAYAKKKGFK